MDVKADSSVLNEKNLPDIEKMKPIIWNMAEMTYHKVGKSTGQSFSIGKEIEQTLKSSKTNLTQPNLN